MVTHEASWTPHLCAWRSSSVASMKPLLASCWRGGDCLRRHAADERTLAAAWVPGALEIPLVAQRLARPAQFDAVICRGAVIRGATTHFEHVTNQAAAGVARVALDTRTPVTFAILTTDTIQQAVEWAGTKAGNKGFDAALAAIEMANLIRQLRVD